MCLNPSQCSTKICWKTFQSCAGAASMRAHRVGVVGGVQCSFCTTSHHLSPPPHRPSPRHAHLPLSPLSHGDFRPVAKCKFLDDRDTVDGCESPHGESVVRDAGCPYRRKAPEQSWSGAAARPEWRKKHPQGGLTTAAT